MEKCAEDKGVWGWKNNDAADKRHHEQIKYPDVKYEFEYIQVWIRNLKVIGEPNKVTSKESRRRETGTRCDRHQVRQIVVRQQRGVEDAPALYKLYPSYILPPILINAFQAFSEII